ncbi:hypothetical protein NCC49_002908 [Naganishia albida]|nr:hypothetical protein NCC49_002908 [Naganishia albida]
MRSRLPTTRITLRSSRTYSCSSSANTGKPSSPGTATTTTAPTSKLRMAMTARKLLGAEGSGRLAMRRESMSSRRPGATRPAPPRATGRGFTSPAAAYIANPSAFRPVHLYAPQYALHASFTPSHMPLPVHLGVQTYYKPDQRYAADADADADVFAPRDEGVRRKAVRNVIKVAERKGISNLREHLATVANFSTHPSLASLLHTPLPTATADAHDAEEPTAAAYDGFTLGDFTPTALFGGTADHPSARPFAELVHARLGAGAGAGAAGRPAQAQTADEAWETVLSRMSAAQSTPSPSPASTTMCKESTPEEITDAVAQVTALLARLIGTSAPRTAFLRRASTPRTGRITRMARRRPSGADVALDQVAWMDSVKRKRQKKISKHKYKKRRKATRAERKKLGK